MVVLDFETFYDKDFSLSKISTESYIRSLQFEVIGVCLKKDDGPIEWVSGPDEEIKDALIRYGCSQDICVAHNAAFDMAIMSWRYDIQPKIIVDTLSMSRPITGLSCGGSLRALSRHFGLGEKGDEVYNTKGKHRRDFTPEELARFGEYCKQDVNLTYQLYWKLKPLSTPQEMYLIDLIIRMFTEPKIVLDKPLLEKHLAEVQAAKQKLLDNIEGSKDSLMSNNLFAEKLRELGVDPPTKVSPTTGKQTYAFAKTDLGFQALLEHPDERVQALAAARLGVKSTLEETRTQSFIGIAERGTMPIMLNYYGAGNTGRLSGGDGTNPQNLPRGGLLRKAMRAPEGYVIIACDSSQVEARTTAWFAGQEDLVSDFAHDRDVYSIFASAVYGRTITKHENPNERHVGKTCILGLGYGSGPAVLQRSLHNGVIRVDLPLEETKRIVNLYRTKYFKIPAGWKEGQRVLNCLYEGYNTTIGVGVKLTCDPRTKSILLPNGMTIKFPGLTRTQGEYGWEYMFMARKVPTKMYGAKVFQNIIQALARIVVCSQMCKIKQMLDARNRAMNDGKIRQIVHMVHDEVIAIVPEDEAKLTKAVMEKVMSTAPKWAPGLPISCECDFGKTYGDAK